MANYKITKTENGEKRLEKLEKVLNITFTLIDKKTHSVGTMKRTATPETKKAIIDFVKNEVKEEGFKVVDILAEKAIKITYVDFADLDKLDIFHD
jgi:hypothetical protein